MCGEMNRNLRRLIMTGLVFSLLVSCYPPGDEKAQKSLDTFTPYVPSDNVNAISNGTSSEISVGIQHTCALRAGTLSCWGLNDNGQIGNEDGGFTAGATDPYSGENPAPKVVTKPYLVMTGVESVGVGYEHSCAVKSKNLYCWGSNAKGQLGLGAKPSSEKPALVPIGEPVLKVRARGYLTCAVAESGKLFCFGSRITKKLSGDTGPQIVSSSPLAVLGEGVTGVSLSTSHICALHNESLKCLGYNGWGEIGDSTRMNQDVPGFFEVLNSKATAVAVGENRSCAIQNGKMLCFGKTLGDRAIDNTPAAKWQVPEPAPTEASFWNTVMPWTKISGSGAVLNQLKELFYGSYFHNQGVPKKIALKVHDFDFSEKDQNGCLMFQNLEVRCWGSNTLGQLGNGQRSVSESPITQANLVSFK